MSPGTRQCSQEFLDKSVGQRAKLLTNTWIRFQSTGTTRHKPWTSSHFVTHAINTRTFGLGSGPHHRLRTFGLYDMPSWPFGPGCPDITSVKLRDSLPEVGIEVLLAPTTVAHLRASACRGLHTFKANRCFSSSKTRDCDKLCSPLGGKISGLQDLIREGPREYPC